MRHTTLGSTGCSISRVALGTMTFGNQTPDAEAFEQLDRFVEVGGTLIDTADVYSAGESERILGRWLAARPGVRERVVVATKARFPTGAGTNDLGLSRVHLARALEGSLRRLGVETIDLYQAHAFDPRTPLEETMRFLDDAVSGGKIHYSGLSNFTGWQVQRAVDVAHYTARSSPVALQAQYNLLARDLEWEIVPAVEANGLGLLVWSPLAAGMLAGTRPLDGPGQDDHRGARIRAVLEVLRSIAAVHDVSPARIALAWVAAQPAVSAVILGARTMAQLEDNLAAFDIVLSTEELDRLTRVSEGVVDDYPYGSRGREQRLRQLEGGR